MGSKPTITVISFLWGGWYGLKKEYLSALEKGIRSHTTFPLRFVCLSPDEKGPIGSWEFLPLKAPSEKQNLKKLGLYNPANGFHGRLFVVDLDVIIVGSLDDLFSLDGEFYVKAEHTPYLRGTLVPDGDIYLQNVNKATWDKVWNFINRNIGAIQANTRGRERKFYQRYAELFWNVTFLQAVCPGRIFSYKRDKIYRTKEIPEGASLISFHGRKAKPHYHNWIMERYWYENHIDNRGS